MALSATHRTILVVDVEKFSDHSRTDSQRVRVHDGLYQALHQALREVGIGWDDCHHEDRGDGVLILAPPQIPKARFSDDLPVRLAEALRLHNQAHPVAEHIRLRIALNAGGFTSTGTERYQTPSTKLTGCLIPPRSRKPCETHRASSP